MDICQSICTRRRIGGGVSALHQSVDCQRDGQPLFAITQAVDPGLLSMLRQSIIPRLKRELPGQPSAEQLAADP
jgi:Transposase protein